uniref:Uncharacterized protein n=1 Tax=Romanomermis culicivorax TaxID=13658 RepID=A0A915JZ63_ROMCU
MTSRTYLLRVVTAAFPLLGWLSWLARADGSRKVLGSSPGPSLTFTETLSSGNRLPQHLHPKFWGSLTPDGPKIVARHWGPVTCMVQGH